MIKSVPSFIIFMLRRRLEDEGSFAHSLPATLLLLIIPMAMQVSLKYCEVDGKFTVTHPFHLIVKKNSQICIRNSHSGYQS